MDNINQFPIRAIEISTSFMTCDVMDMSYFDPLIKKASDHGINAVTIFIIPDSYYPETSSKKSWLYEEGLDWPSEKFPQYRNINCLNSNPEKEFIPDLISLCHSLNMKVYLRTINNKHRWLYPQHENWRALRLSTEGKAVPTHACCWDISNFMDYYYAVLRELLERYATGTIKADGLLLDQQKLFGPYINEESQIEFERRTGNKMDFTKIQQLRDYWSSRNAERVKDTVEFAKKISPELEIGLTVEAVKEDHFLNGESGLKHELHNLQTTQTDFMHHQIFDHSDDELFNMWEEFTLKGPLWIMLDPTASDAGWKENYWGWQPQTPESIKAEIQKVKRIKATLTKAQNLLGISQFPINRLPLNHKNLTAALKETGAA